MKQRARCPGAHELGSHCRVTRALLFLVSVLSVAVFVSACSGDPTPTPTDTADRPEDRPFPTGDACEGMEILRVAPWVGGGLQLTVAFDTPPADAEAIALSGLPNRTPALALAPPASTVGYTGVLLVPSADPSEHAARIAAAVEVVRDAPDGDRVIAWSATEPPALVADTTRDRAHVIARLEASPSGPATYDDAVRTSVLETLDRLGGPWGALPRDLYVIGAEGDRVVDRESLRTIGACGPFPEGVDLTLTAGDAHCAFTSPAPNEDLRDAACEPGDAAADDWPFPDTVGLRFESAGARARFDALDADGSEDEFDVQITLGRARSVDARAHFRGQSSLGCDRKNLAVNLSGAWPRRLFPGAADDELLLISMCLDDGYVNQAVANRLMRKLELLPIGDRFVDLYIDGEPRGVYLILQKPVDTLRRDLARLAGVIRRRFDPEDKPEDIDFPDDEAGRAWAIERYREIVARIDATPPEGLLEALSADLDFDSYLRWLALASYLQNGDFVDEVLFYVSDEAAGPWFRVHGWDSDDLFSACHHSGKFAFDDPHGLTYCIEGDLDRALLVSEDVYDRYVDILEEPITETLPPAAVEEVVDWVHHMLWTRLESDPLCRAMTEVGPADCEELREVVSDRTRFLMTAVNARAEELLEGIAVYRGQR